MVKRTLNLLSFFLSKVWHQCLKCAPSVSQICAISVCVLSVSQIYAISVSNICHQCLKCAPSVSQMYAMSISNECQHGLKCTGLVSMQYAAHPNFRNMSTAESDGRTAIINRIAVNCAWD